MKNNFTKIKVNRCFSKWCTAPLFIFFIFIGMQSAKAQYTAIPDVNFEQRLITLGIDSGAIDHQVLTANVSSVTYLYVSSESISSLVGIQAFTSLTDLYCSNNLLTSLNLSGLNNLSTLYCNENKLTTLNLSGCTSLQSLNCRYNYLPALNLSSTPNLLYLVCGGNQFTSLNVTSLTNLNLLDCGKFHSDNESFSVGFDLINIDSYLIDNYASNAPISSLTVDGLANLGVIYSSGNNLSSLNLTGLTSLSILKSQNNISSINLSGLSNLTVIDLAGNPLTSLNISGLNNLVKVYLPFTNITSLNASGLTHLKDLTVQSPNLTSLNVTGCTALVDLNCSHSKLSTLSLTGFSLLQSLQCADNLLTTLNLTGCNALRFIICNENKLSSLNLFGFSNLIELQVASNLLTSLDLRNLTNLGTMGATNNPLLSCISTNNVNVANANESWTKDATASYSTNCNGVQLTKVRASQCGVTLAKLNTDIMADNLPSATEYRFKVVANGTTEVIERGIRRYFNLTALTTIGAAYNTSYTISVAVRKNGDWESYGAECVVSTPALPTTQVRAAQCSTTLASKSTDILADNLQFATAYRFKVVVNGTAYEINPIANRRYFKLTSLPIPVTAGTTYIISVAAQFNGVWGTINYGSQCNVITPGIISNAKQATEATSIATTDFSAIAYPNPSNSAFNLQINGANNENVSLLVFDMTGRQIENKVVNAAAIENITLGQNYSTGIYNVVVSQGRKTKVVRLMKQ
jgi:Leucine-rich repeat (LRR) protein